MKVGTLLLAGHLNINGCKMSKSLKNFISIRSVSEKLHFTTGPQSCRSRSFYKALSF